MALRSLFLPVLFVLNLCFCLFQETAAKRITKTGYLLHQQLSKVTPVAQEKSEPNNKTKHHLCDEIKGIHTTCYNKDAENL